MNATRSPRSRAYLAADITIATFFPRRVSSTSEPASTSSTMSASFARALAIVYVLAMVIHVHLDVPFVKLASRCARPVHADARSRPPGRSRSNSAAETWYVSQTRDVALVKRTQFITVSGEEGSSARELFLVEADSTELKQTRVSLCSTGAA